jgi:hypothetical protein
MSHYIAELITIAEEAAKHEKRDAMLRCSVAILELWSHRSKWPDRVRPFNELEPIISTLGSLRPEAKNPFYRQHFWERAEQEVIDDELKNWLQIAHGLDYTARLLIGFAIEQAVRISTAKSISWVKEAAQAQDTSGLDVELSVKLLSWATETRRNDEVRREAITNRLDRLKAFLDMAGEIEKALRSELADLSQSPS